MYSSPSRKHGISHNQEENLRRRYVLFLRALGKALGLPQHPTVASATMLCHRFFMYQSHSLNDCFLIASACLFLAAKAEDTPCPLSHIVSTSLRLRRQSSFKSANKHEPDKDTQLLLHAECLVLTTLSFDLAFDDPYKPLLTAIAKLKQSPQMEKELIVVGGRNVKQELKGAATHVSWNKSGRGGHPMAKDNPENVSCNRRDMGQVLNNTRAQHQSIKSSSRNEHVGRQPSAFASNLNSQYCNRRLPKRSATTAPDGDVDPQNKRRRREPNTHAAGQSGVEEMCNTHAGCLREAGEKAFLQVAWNFVNDSTLSYAGLLYKPHVIAAGAIQLAAKFLDVRLPSEGKREWWQDMDVTPLQLQEVRDQILEVYTARQ